jgi:hypothetical protein
MSLDQGARCVRTSGKSRVRFYATVYNLCASVGLQSAPCAFIGVLGPWKRRPFRLNPVPAEQVSEKRYSVAILRASTRLEPTVNTRALRSACIVLPSFQPPPVSRKLTEGASAVCGAILTRHPLSGHPSSAMLGQPTAVLPLVSKLSFYRVLGRVWRCGGGVTSIFQRIFIRISRIQHLEILANEANTGTPAILVLFLL